MKEEGHDWVKVEYREVEDKISRRRKLGRCKVCGRTLTAQQSIWFGIGPICRENYPGIENSHTEEEVDQFLRKVWNLPSLDSGTGKVRTYPVYIYPVLPNFPGTLPCYVKPPISPPISHEPVLYDDEYEKAKSFLSHYRDRPFREHQKEAVKFIMNSQKKYVFLEAPTGSGKSLIAMVAGMVNGGMIYSVHTKILQEQITNDFPEAASLFGKASYQCKKNPTFTCDDCLNTKKMNREECGGACLYENAKNKCLNTRLKILNYDVLLNSANYANRFTGSDFNLVDEADNLEATLLGFMELSFTEYNLTRLKISHFASALKKTSIDKEALLDSWKKFGEAARAECLKIVASLEAEVDSLQRMKLMQTENGKKAMRDFKRMSSLLTKINIFLANVDTTWILDTVDSKFTFRPIWVNEDLAQRYFWRHAKKWVLMSASFLPIMLEAKRLGIPLDECDYMSLPSTFPVERRQVYVEDTVSLSKDTIDRELPKLATRIREIMAAHPSVKGLIHGVSYKLCDQIIRAVGSPRLITHGKMDRPQVLERLRRSPTPLVLVSPSMERGVSLEQDDCRFVIVAKAPFLNLGDKIVNARVFTSKLGQEWYTATMLSTVLQMCGRGMRSKDDFCECYILDDNFKKALQKKPGYLPKWWKDAIAW